MQNSAMEKLITHMDKKSYISEAYRILRTNIEFTNVDSEVQMIMVTSSIQGEGKTVTTANLAVTMAQSGKSVLVIDADMRKGCQSSIFDINDAEGLSNFLASNKSIDDFIKDSAIPGLKIVTRGPVPPNPAELIASRHMKELIKEVRSRYDIILFDTPPTLAVTDAAILAREMDGVVLVIGSGGISKEYVRRTCEQLKQVGAKILGVVINKAEIKAKDKNYY